MGQAKARGSFEKRQAEALFYKSERERLDAWLKSRRPKTKRDRVTQRLAAVLMAHGVACIPLSNSHDW